MLEPLGTLGSWEDGYNLKKY